MIKFPVTPDQCNFASAGPAFSWVCSINATIFSMHADLLSCFQKISACSADKCFSLFMPKCMLFTCSRPTSKNLPMASFLSKTSLKWEAIPGPLPLFCTTSNRKLSGAWEQGHIHLAVMWNPEVTYFNVLKFFITLGSASAVTPSSPMPVHRYLSQSRLI